MYATQTNHASTVTQRPARSDIRRRAKRIRCVRRAALVKDRHRRIKKDDRRRHHTALPASASVGRRSFSDVLGRTIGAGPDAGRRRLHSARLEAALRTT